MKSMTGYGRADFSINGDSFTVEIKGLNHRFLEIDIKLPDRFFPLEFKARDEIKKIFSRGSLKVYIRSSDKSITDISANIDTAKRYVGEIEKIKAALDLSGDIDIGTLINFRDIFAASGKVFDAEKDWQMLRQGISEAAKNVLTMREDEGAALLKDILNRVNIIEKTVIDIEKLSQHAADAYKEKIKSRMQLFLKDAAVDEARLLNEVAIFSDRCCIDEEIVRLKSHLSLFRSLLDSAEPVGRKMDFLCQEILRELNTIASKTQDVEISHFSIESKTELEKIREQVQNIE
ncbi:MAG: YicC family protein [Deltaproteobacteria bacterium]|nr:YicC family protein [Deltaproteobacteria bacterium]